MFTGSKASEDHEIRLSISQHDFLIQSRLISSRFLPIRKKLSVLNARNRKTFHAFRGQRSGRFRALLGQESTPRECQRYRLFATPLILSPLWSDYGERPTNIHGKFLFPELWLRGHEKNVHDATTW